MTTIEEKVNDIIANAGNEYNSLPIEERLRIGKYMSYYQILTLWQTLHKNTSLVTPAWIRKQTAWLENCVNTYRSSYFFSQKEETDG